MNTEPTVFTISRSFNAPRDVLWSVWTENDHLKKWFGPKGCPITRTTLNFSVGGSYHYGIRIPDGSEMWGRWVFREIAKPSRIVWEHHFSDAEGSAITRHPFSPTWPLEMLATIVLEEQGEKTTLTLTLACMNATDIERKTWEAGMVSMNQGWGGTLDQLTDYLESIV